MKKPIASTVHYTNIKPCFNNNNNNNNNNNTKFYDMNLQEVLSEELAC